MSSAQDTDMAIAGEGFFSVRNKVTNAINYTRAGVFTLNNDGYMEDPSGNILQGWQMSIPKPGEAAVKIGAPTDIKITVLNAPPVETSEMKVVVNLNAGDKSAYKYEQHQLAHEMADSIAKPQAESARNAAQLGYWNPNIHSPAGTNGAPVPPVAPDLYGTPVDIDFSSTTPEYQAYFVQAFNEKFAVNPPLTVADLPNFRIYSDGVTLENPHHAVGFMTVSDFNAVAVIAESECVEESKLRGQTAYDTVYDSVYDSTKTAITTRLPNWQLEGNGFAGAWNAQNDPHISTDNYTHVEPMVIYDTLGNEHKLMVYFQKNPHMANVWDYIITCDPADDARKDGILCLLFSENASFSGLIQKGKFTFVAYCSVRHWRLFIDFEAENIDLSKTLMSQIDLPTFTPGSTSTMRGATIGGYYTGSPYIATADGSYNYASSARTYTLKWGGVDQTKLDADLKPWENRCKTWAMAQVPKQDWSDPVTQQAYMDAMDLLGTPDLKPDADNPIYWGPNVGSNPVSSGLTWVDDLGQTGFIPIDDPNVPGPYTFGSGMTITFDASPMRFGTPGVDNLEVTAHSEQIAWTNIDTNDQGYFDFDVAFVQSASMALHPPYPSGLPTVIQNIAFDMGARRNPAGNDPKWILDEQSTTQFASKSSTVFSAQDGYPAGSLQRVSIGEDGVITGIYTNGRQQPLYQVGLTRFLNPWGLSKEGDNLFSATRYSGEGALNEPGYGGTGTILGNFLEQSNVDLAEEIVNMITTQRGFQANSKTVTTVDTMMAEVIEMKR